MASDGGGEGGIIWNPAGIVARGIAEGMSGRQIIAALREGGAGIRDSVAYKMISEVRASIANREHVAGLDTSLMPSANDYARWTTNRTGFSTQMLVFTRDRETGMIGSTVSSYTTVDPHTPDEAIAAKQADWEDLTDTGNEYEDQQYLGAVPFNLFAMGPE